ncbi:unnamed protein product [Rotaria socialis]|uniref:Helix-turn-helix domain-containing protein n=1 Tax=Rotaria socialis TaxID=392032 RepID=A0A821I594_9BILA|nr:unnamed protein product [Rotaria socialis]
MKDFALVLYILGGKQCYEFFQINIIGALSNLTTTNKLISNTNPILTEGQFCFVALKQYLETANVKFDFCAEDCAGVIKKIKYDANTNSFVGFNTKLSNGVPICNYYRTDSYEQLQYWFENIEKSALLNIHMFQPIPQSNHINSPASFLLSAYGVDNTATAIDIIKRWIYIYNNCIQNQIRIIGFSTDGDPKYVRAMRLTCGFIALSSNSQHFSHSDAFQIKIGGQWQWSWFFLGQRQIFLFLQDPTHLITKWRNRLLSKVAEMRIGNQIIKIPLDTIRKLASIVLEQNVCVYDKKIYQQVLGGAMGSSFTLTLNISQYIYVEMVKRTCSSTRYDSLPFLDVLLTNINGTLSTSVYHKPAAEPYVVPFISDHPRHVFENIVQTSLRRAIKYSSTFQLFNDERRYIKSTFLYNGYPSSFIDKTFRKFFSGYVTSQSFRPFFDNEAQFIQMRNGLSGQPSRKQSQVEMRIATLTNDNDHLVEDLDKKEEFIIQKNKNPNKLQNILIIHYTHEKNETDSWEQ